MPRDQRTHERSFVLFEPIISHLNTEFRTTMAQLVVELDEMAPLPPPPEDDDELDNNTDLLFSAGLID